MSRLRIIVSLPNQNHYQQAQAKAAQLKAGGLGGEVQVLDADNDAVNQSQQLLAVLQSSSTPLPTAILVEPLTSSGLGKVAAAAVAAGVAWVLLNSQADYLEQLRAKAKAAVFAVTRDHTEIGRIQGRQFAALLPGGGTVLYIQGPNTSAAATQRTRGAESVSPGNISLRPLRSQWTEESGRETVDAWLRLSTSRPGSRSTWSVANMTVSPGALVKPFRRLPGRKIATAGCRCRSPVSMGWLMKGKTG